jgi:hypothetical protein
MAINNSDYAVACRVLQDAIEIALNWAKRSGLTEQEALDELERYLIEHQSQGKLTKVTLRVSGRKTCSTSLLITTLTDSCA